MRHTSLSLSFVGLIAVLTCLAAEPGFKIRNPCAEAFEKLARRLDGVTPSSAAQELTESPYNFIMLDSRTDPSDIKKQLKRQGQDFLIVDPHVDLSDATRNLLDNSGVRFCIKSGEGSAAISKYLQHWMHKTEIIAAIPTDAAGVRNIYGVADLTPESIERVLSQTKPAYRDLKMLRNSVHQVQETPPVDLATHAKSRMAGWSGGGDAPFLIFVGHSEGGNLRFPDNSTLRIQEIYDTLAANKRHGLVLSCNTFDQVPTSYAGFASVNQIGFGEAVRGLSAAQKALDRQNCIYLGDYLYLLEMNLDASAGQRLHKTRIALAVAGAGTIGSVIPIVANKDSRDESNPVTPKNAK